MGQGELPALAQHHVEVELAREPFLQPQREVIKPRALRTEVVRAHDRGVSSGIAEADRAFFLMDRLDAVFGEDALRRERIAQPMIVDAPRQASWRPGPAAPTGRSREGAVHARIAFPAGS